MAKNLTVDQLYDLQMQRWEHENPVKDVAIRCQERKSPMNRNPFSEAWALKESRRRPTNAREMILDRYGHRYSDTESAEQRASSS